nr:hypothetical protein [Qaidamihabitans albus]
MTERADRPESGRGGKAWLMLGLATLGFALNFWAWALLSPLAPGLQQELALSSFEQALVVAVPIVSVRSGGFR